MSNDKKDKSDNTIFNNLIFVVLIVLLAIGAYKSNSRDFSAGNFLDNVAAQKNKVHVKNVPEEDFDTSIFNQIQEKRVRQKIDYSTASEFVKQRELSGTEILELEKRPVTSKYFVRHSTKKIIFYPTTGSGSGSQAFMREFTKFRTSKKQNPDLVFIPVETGFGISEKQIKNSSDRVFYNLKKECGKFCIINVPSRNFMTLSSPEIGAKTFEVAEVIINSL